jgi:hypothetical protein
MIDFAPVRAREMTTAQLGAGMAPADLRRHTNEMIDAILAMIAESADEDVTRVVEDPDANDTFAASADDVRLSWTLGHVIVHVTASAEESAFLAAELARGVPHREGRSRSEVPWQAIATVAQCRERLEESRRMRLASLDIWPAQPDLANSYEARPGGGPVNAVTRFLFGLSHDDAHLGQIARLVEQTRVARQRPEQ